MCPNSGRDVIPGDRVAPADRRARAAVAFLSVVMSTSNGAWAARIPDVRGRLSISDASWGLANTTSAGVNLAMLAFVAGLLIGRVPARQLAIIGAAGNLLAMPLLAQTSSAITLTAGLSIWGTASCLMGIPMGALQIEVQRRYQRSLQGGFLACFGVGTFAGSGYGTAAAALGISVGHQFIGSSVILLGALTAAARWLPHELTRPAEVKRQPLRHRFTPQLRALAIVAGLSQFITITLELWAAYYVATNLGGGATTGAAAYTAMSVSGVVAALAADRIIVRFGDLTVFRIGTILAALGIGLGLAVNDLYAVTAGFILLGIGMSCAGPTMYSFISKQNAVPAAEAVSVIELGDNTGALIAPTLIGGLASLAGLRASLATITAAAAAMTLLSRSGSTPA